MDTGIFFFSIWVFFHEHSRFTGKQGKGEGIYLTPLYHFHPLHRHLDISRAITAGSSPLHIAGSRTRTGNLWLPTASRQPPSYTKLHPMYFVGIFTSRYFNDYLLARPTSYPVTVLYICQRLHSTPRKSSALFPPYLHFLKIEEIHFFPGTHAWSADCYSNIVVLRIPLLLTVLSKHSWFCRSASIFSYVLLYLLESATSLL